MTNPTPTLTIHGEKIILRSFRAEDSRPLWESVQNEREINRLTGTHTKFTREMIDNYVAKQIDNDDDSRAALIIALPDDSRTLGEIVINDIDRNNNSLVIHNKNEVICHICNRGEQCFAL